MKDSEILNQIRLEYELGYEYVRPVRERYRDRLLKWLPSNRKDKININMIANVIDIKIASSFTNGVKAKFISRQGWIGEEEAGNLNSVAEFDSSDPKFQQIKYQLEQDSHFFGIGICNKVGWDKNESKNTYRAINPLAWIPDPLPTQIGQFDGQNYRFHGFTMTSNVFDMVKKYGKEKMDGYLRQRYEETADDQLTREKYSQKAGTGYITCDSLYKNFNENVYNHYTIVDGKKWLFKTDIKFSYIFDREEIKPVLKEEKLDPLLCPRPVMLMFSNPQRGHPFGISVCDILEDKQNAKSILANLNIIKAKKEALGGDFLVNSRLIKNKDELRKKTTDTRYLFVDEEAIGNNPIQNAMFELPQSQIKTDTFNMINFLDSESKIDSKTDQMQSGIVSDKTMTKGEAQTVQANANQIVGKEVEIKNRFWSEFYKQRLRGYLENFKEGSEKFLLLSDNFEWKGLNLKKDQFLLGQNPYIVVGSVDYINAINEKNKQYLNMLYPQIVADPEMPMVCKNIFKRLVHRVNGLKENIINSFMKYDPNERQAIEYVNMLNVGHMPEGIFSNPNADLFTYWLYIQKADDSVEKEKILRVLSRALIDLGLDGKSKEIQDMQMSNSAANIAMSQGLQGEGEVVARK